MTKRSAEDLVLKANPGYSVVKTYFGTIGDDDVYGFVISKDRSPLHRFLLVYSDGTVTGVDGSMAMLVVNSLTEV